MAKQLLNVSIVKRDGHDFATATYVDDAGQIATAMRQDDDGSAQDAVRAFTTGTASVDDVLAVFSDVACAQARARIEDEVVHSVNVLLAQISDHIRIDRDHALYDHDPFEEAGLSSVLENHLVRLFKESPKDTAPWRAWCLFCEKLHDNVNPDVRSQLFGWLKAQGWLTLTSQGDLVGYRGGAPSEEYGMVSIHEGPAIVNGEHVNGHVPNPVGAVVEMPRSDVEFDPASGCSSGLHVGTYDYARSWSAGPIAKVVVNPADIVSVPYDCDAQKIRCCRFRVIEIEKDAVKVDWERERDMYYDDDDFFEDDGQAWPDAYDEGYAEGLHYGEIDGLNDVRTHEREVGDGAGDYRDAYDKGYANGYDKARAETLDDIARNR